MRRLFAFLLCFALACVPLGGCARAEKLTAAQSDDVPTLEEGSHGANEMPVIRTEDTANAQLAPDAAENTPGEESMSGEEFLQSIFANVGRLYFKENELEAFRALDPTAEHTFMVQDYFGAQRDERLARYNEMNTLQWEMEQMYQKAELGETPAGEYDFDRSVYTFVDNTFMDEDVLSRLPREWFDNEQMLADYFATEYDLSAILSVRNEYARKSAEAFAALGCKAEVRQYTESVTEQGMHTDVCIVTVSPERLWSLGEKAETAYLVEDFTSTLRERFDSVIWSSEG